MLTNQSQDLAYHHFLAIISFMRSFICIFLLLIATSVEARIYQWVNPSTGSTQLSGKAPAWYRSDMGGPRVLVFENNVLVDDTGVAVDEDQRIQLRAKALSSESGKKSLTTEQAVATLEDQIQAILDSSAMNEYLKNPPAQTDQAIAPEVPSSKGSTEQKDKDASKSMATESPDERVERLKALISAWDKNKTEEAKSLLNSEMQTTEQQKKASEK